MVKLEWTTEDIERILSWFSAYVGEGFSDPEDYELAIDIFDAFPDVDDLMKEFYKKELKSLR